MRKVNWTKPKREAKRLLERLGIDEAPVPVDRITQEIGIEVRYRGVEDDVSGFIYRQGDTAVIGINSAHHGNRQRFTLAHELGHFVLHDRDLFQNSDVHVDRDVVRFRDAASSQATDPAEIEANAFAAELLMPEDFLKRDVAQIEEDQDAESLVEELARRYKVSAQAMAIRLSKLDLICG